MSTNSQSTHEGEVRLMMQTLITPDDGGKGKYTYVVRHDRYSEPMVITAPTLPPPLEDAGLGIVEYYMPEDTFRAMRSQYRRDKEAQRVESKPSLWESFKRFIGRNL